MSGTEGQQGATMEEPSEWEGQGSPNFFLKGQMVYILLSASHSVYWKFSTLLPQHEKIANFIYECHDFNCVEFSCVKHYSSDFLFKMQNPVLAHG